METVTTSLPQRQVIAASWQRARDCGLAPDARPDPVLADISSSDPLLDAARPILARAAEQLHGTPAALLLVDHRSRMVARVSADASLERTLADAGAVTGATLTEAAMGTTALGTVAEVRGEVVINAEDHYLEQFRFLSCFGQPIIHPTTRRVAGILCMTQAAPRLNPLSVPLVRGVVEDIADRLLSRASSDHRRVIAAYEKAAERRDTAVAALGDDLQLSNSLAAQLLAPGDFGTLRLLVEQNDVPPTITLLSGVTVAVQAVRVPSVRHAAVFRLRPQLSDLSPASSPSRSTAAGAPTVAICGEPGTGRTARAFTVADREAAVVIDVPAALIDDAPIDLAAALRLARSRGHGVVIDGADLLDERSLALLQSAVSARSGAEPPIVVVTGPPDALGPGAAALVARCRHRTTLPPLRQRSTELAALAQEFLRADSLELGADAADALASQDWPGNFPELAMVLEQAAAVARARGSRTLDVHDLPHDYRGSARVSRLLGLEHAERLAIVDALDAAGGNKSHAAKTLGISRTTLYARIRALDIGH